MTRSYPLWGESSVFVLLANGNDNEPIPGKGKRWFALILLILMIAGATIGELPVVKEMFPDMKLDMFFLFLSLPLSWLGLKFFRHVNTLNIFPGIS